MSIPTMSSQKLNDIYSDANTMMTDANNRVTTIKTDMEQKLNVINYELGYLNSRFSKIDAGGFKSLDYSMFNAKTIGNYEMYGATIYPKLIKSPVNVFNLSMSQTGQMFFRNDMYVSLNGIFSDSYKDVLKHDSLNDKTIFFNEMNTDTVNLTVLIDDTNILGPTAFNMIEIDSFLPGSYDITEVDLYYYDDNKTLVPDPVKTTTMYNAGKEVLILDKKYNLYKIVFNIKINYNVKKGDTTIYPFGIKHLYFYNADFRTDSYVIIGLEYDKNITSVADAINIMAPDSTYASTITEEGIELYSSYTNGTLTNRIYPSTSDDTNKISRLINTLYVKIPVTKALLGIKFDISLSA